MLNAIQPVPQAVKFGKTPTDYQFRALQEMVLSFPQMGEEVADRMTPQTVDYHKAGITLPGQIKLIPGVLAGFIRSLRAAHHQANRTAEPAYSVQWMELPNTPSAQAWVHSTDEAAGEQGENRVNLYEEDGHSVIKANYENHLLVVRRINPKTGGEAEMHAVAAD